MKRIGQVCFIDGEENERLYAEYHEKIPEEIARCIHDCNLRNYSIFIRDGMLFTYCEYIGSDYESDMKKIAASADMQKWWGLVKPLMSPLKTRKKDEFWADMQSIFYQD